LYSCGKTSDGISLRLALHHDLGFLIAGADDLLVVQMEVEVSGKPGMYSPQPIIDFGMLHTLSEDKQIPLFIINSSTEPVDIVVRYTDLKYYI